MGSKEWDDLVVKNLRAVEHTEKQGKGLLYEVAREVTIPAFQPNGEFYELSDDGKLLTGAFEGERVFEVSPCGDGVEVRPCGGVASLFVDKKGALEAMAEHIAMAIYAKRK